MALSTRPLSFASVAVAAPGTSVSPSVGLPNNCVGVVILNTSTTIPLLVGIGAPGGALTEGVDATRIPASAAIELPVGDVSRRGIMDESVLVGSGLIFDAIGGVGSADLTYLNALG
jgi:hypothetical protein